MLNVSKIYNWAKEPLYTIWRLLKWPLKGWTVQDMLFQLQAQNRSAKKKIKAFCLKLEDKESLKLTLKSFPRVTSQKWNDWTAFSWYNFLQWTFLRWQTASTIRSPIQSPIWSMSTQRRVRIFTSSQRSDLDRKSLGIWILP